MLKDESVPKEQNAFIMTLTSNPLPCLHGDDGACQPKQQRTCEAVKQLTVIKLLSVKIILPVRC